MRLLALVLALSPLFATAGTPFKATTWEAAVEIRSEGRIVTTRTLRLRANEPSSVEVASGGGDGTQRVEIRIDTSDEATWQMNMRYLTRDTRSWVLRAQTAFGWPADDLPPASASLNVPAAKDLPAIEVRLRLTTLP